MQELNLPSFDFKINHHKDSYQIFDEFRMKYVQLTPEEWVRQHFIRFLVNFKNFPKGLIAVEKELKINGLKRRPDAVVYNKDGDPILLLEFKAPDVSIDEETFFQVAMYNKKLEVPQFILSNGIEHFVGQIDYKKSQLNLLDEIPDYHLL